MSTRHTQTLDQQQYRINGVRFPDNSDTHTITLVNGMIKSIELSDKAAHAADSVNIDAGGCLALPGLVDLYSRCREPGQTRKGNIASESTAAQAAGFTQVLCSPDTVPAVDSVATVELITHRSEQVQGGARIIPMAAMTIGLQGQQLSELATLQAAGCPVATQADQPIDSATVLHSAMQYASSFDMPLLLNARDAQLGKDGCAHNGATATQLGLPTIPVAAETVALGRLIELCRETRCRLHISRISSSRAVQHIHDAKQAGLPISCDVGIHHLFYSDELLAGYDAAFHSAVPFRSHSDRQALRDGLRTGVIDAICSDHAPHDIDAGLAPFPVTEPGLSAYGWFTPLMLQIPEITGLSLGQVVEKLHHYPLTLLNRNGHSGIKVGQAANFFLVDSDAAFTMDHADILSAGSNNPLTQHQASSLNLSPLRGKVTAVFHAGNVTQYA